MTDTPTPEPGEKAEPSHSGVSAPTERFRTAASWSFVMNVGRLVATTGTTFVLASLLGPTAFGTVALALIYITLLQLLMQQGLVPAVIQRHPLTERHLDSAFWLTIGAAVILTIVSVALSGWWADVNGTPDAGVVIRALSVLVLIKGLVAVQEAWLRRQLQFRSLAIRTTVASVAGAVVGITWAIAAPSIWALVAQQLVTEVTGCVVLWSVSSWRPRLRFYTGEARQLIGFAGKASVASIGVFLNNRFDSLLIGVYFGATAVGLYRFAARLVESAIEFTVQPLQHVALPEFARYQDNPPRSQRRYRALVLMSTTMAATAMACLFASAQSLMAVVGPEWDSAVAPLRLLCVVGVVRAITMLNGSALQALGRPGVQARMTWTSAVLSGLSFAAVGLLLADSEVGVQVVGIALSRAVLYGFVLLPLAQVWYVNRLLGAPFGTMIRLLGPTILAAAVAAAIGFATSEALDASGVPPIVQLPVVVGVTLTLCVGMLLKVNPEAKRTFSWVVQRVGRRSRRRDDSLGRGAVTDSVSSTGE